MKEGNFCQPALNLHEAERIASGIVGASLVVLGLSRRQPLGYLAALAGAALVHRGYTGNCKVYEAMGVSSRSARRGRISVPGNKGLKVERSVHVQRPVEEVYRAWRNLENLPNFMEHLQSVEVLDARRSRWTARGPAGTKITWDAEIINEHEDRMISWRSLDGSMVDNAGTVRFEPSHGGTEVRVTLEYNPAGGSLGARVARIFHRDPATEIEADLARFKEWMEKDQSGGAEF